MEQQDDSELRREAELVVVDEVAHDLDAGAIDRGVDGAAQHVEMAVRLSGRQVDARLDHRLAAALRRQAGLDRRQDLLVAERKLLAIEAIEKGYVDRRHPVPLPLSQGR